MRRRRLSLWLRRGLLILLPFLCIGLTLWAILLAAPASPKPSRRVDALKKAVLPAYVQPQLIPMEGTARTGEELEDFAGVVIHYVGNPGTSAAGNRNYFATQGTEVCSHFVVGLEGEVLQCLPLWERSVASNSRNRDTISIEVCHPDDGGQFNEKTYQAVVELTAWLCRTGNLTVEDVIRHYDVTGKECPRYYVRHPQAWDQLKADIAACMENRGNI